jgi:ubiquinol-cytochrome c reductase cytochrome b subunit
VWLAIFVVTFVILGYLGTKPTDVFGKFPVALPVVGGADVATWLARVFTIVYFLFFLLMPFYTAAEKTKPVPERVTH